MTTETLDAEVVSDETTFVPDTSHLPLGGLSGWCQDAKQAVEWELPSYEIERLHLACPAIFGPKTCPDPARKGTFTTQGRRCPCVCHTRPVL